MGNVERGRRGAAQCPLAALCLVSAVWGAEPAAPTAPEPANAARSPAQSAEVLTRQIIERVYATLDPRDADGYERLPEPKPGEWLARFKEVPQTLERYRALDARVRPTEACRTIVLQPLGEFTAEQQQLLEALRDYTQAFFQLPTRLEKPVPLKIDAPGVELTRQVSLGQRHGDYTQQYNAGVILEHLLAPRLPVDAVACMGITMEDLWDGSLNYCFGVGSLNKRVGVYSLCRYYPEFWGNKRQEGDEREGLRRACKVLNHEIGHVFGLWHCVFFRCAMNGSNTRTELDRNPIELCPVCHRKLIWCLGCDPAKRYEDVRAFYQKHGLRDEADWLTGRIERWKKIAAGEAAKRRPEDE